MRNTFTIINIIVTSLNKLLEYIFKLQHLIIYLFIHLFPAFLCALSFSRSSGVPTTFSPGSNHVNFLLHLSPAPGSCSSSCGF